MKRECKACGAKDEVWKFKGGDFFCKRHYYQMYSSGKLRKNDNHRKENEVFNDGEGAGIYLANGEKVFVDPEDLNKVCLRYWGENTQGYIHSRDGKKLIRLHRYILGLGESDKVVDHINRNKLDNRRCNLRVCDHRENTKNLSVKKNNTSGYPGVSKNKATGKWRARIMVDRKEISLGHYEEFHEAVSARIAGEKKYFGEFAPSYSGGINE